MKILSFDLEFNQDPITGPKIIEVGACVGDIMTGEILEHYSAFVNPNQILVPAIIDLTGIQPENLEQADDIKAAYLGMVAIAKRHDCVRMPIVWGIGDGNMLRKELLPQMRWKFGRRELDVKAVFQAYQMICGSKINVGLAAAMEELGLAFKGNQHRALDDAMNTFITYAALLKKFEVPC